MFEDQLLKAGPVTIFLNVILEMRNRLPGLPWFEHYLTHFIVQESADSFYLQTIRVNDANLVQIDIALSIMSAGQNEWIIQ